MEDCISQVYLSPDEIIRICSEASGSIVIGGAPYGNKVVKLTDRLVVKFGVGVTADEAKNQAKAYEMIDRKIVRIPKVHCYFRDPNDRGYIVMELLKGDIKDRLVDDAHLQAVEEIVKYFATFQADRPGPLGGGKSRALVFGEDDEPTFTTIEDMEEWFDQRLLQPANKISLRNFRLVLCHLDLFPRNLIWEEGEAPGVLDWSSAGFYPRILEHCAHLVVGEDMKDFSYNIFARLPALSENESEQIDLILRAWRNMQRYSFALSREKDQDSTVLEMLDCDNQPPPPLLPYPAKWVEELKMS